MDKDLEKALEQENKRQQDNIELIASENFVSKEILNLQGSILTNKYAEGYPHNRYYGGCQYIDIVEEKAIEYACQLFKCNFANVQPHSGSSANLAVYRALLAKGDVIMGMNLSHGGHLTHGHPSNFSGKDYKVIEYTVDQRTELIDYDELFRRAIIEKPRMIIAGASAYSRVIDFKKFREIADEVGAYLVVDMAHIAGLVAAGLHPSPLQYADVVTTTTHKTLRGPRGGLILTNDEEMAKKIDKAVFPGIQGGPLMHVIAAKAQCFAEALQPEFKEYVENIIKNAHALCDSLIQEGFRIVSGGTDNHLLLVDTMASLQMTGKKAEEILDSIGITVNKNMIPFDTEKPAVTSGIRIGTPAMTTRGFREEDFKMIGHIIAEALKNHDNADYMDELHSQVLDLTKKYPLSY